MRSSAPAPEGRRAADDGSELLVVPLLPLKDAVLFPGARERLLIGRARSLAAVRASESGAGLLFAAAQRDAAVEDPAEGDLFPIGVLARLVSSTAHAGGRRMIEIEGLSRARLSGLAEGGARIVTIPENPVVETELGPLLDEAGDAYLALTRREELPDGWDAARERGDATGAVRLLADAGALDAARRQELLELDGPERRLARILSLLGRRDRGRAAAKGAAARVRKKLEDQQKEFLLQEQIRELKKELAHGDAAEASETEELAARAGAVRLTAEARRKFDRELKRLAAIPVFSPESGVIRGYLEWLLELPWGVLTPETADIARVERALDKSHFGLAEVKKRIMEFVAVQQLAGGNKRGTILCLTGPPGVGKTTLAMSIAEALGRTFVRMSLGGMRDEAEIRGHRRTYVGALPGRILQNLRRAGSANPVFLLDEIDKLGSDHRGDPAAALLEVLDPEINHAFQDTYLELEFDLSRVFFITTANALHGVPRPLADRMEVVEIPGYTEREKLEIARRHLVPKQLALAGLTAKELAIEAPALGAIAAGWTREAGVRALEREIQKICRKVALEVLRARGRGKAAPAARATAGTLPGWLGQPRHRADRKAPAPRVGLARGLAWTEAGGQVLDIEARALPGSGQFTVTGRLGEVMRESAQAATTLARDLALARGLVTPESLAKLDVHVHAPEGAIPKDGPSAGVPLTVAVLSALGGLPVAADAACTGEITLLGDVLPVGGLKEKILAAKRAGIVRVVLPEANRRDVAELDAETTRGAKLSFVSRIEEVLDLVLAGRTRPAAPAKNTRTKKKESA